MNLKISDYEMLNFADARLVLSEKGVTTINSSQMWTVLKEIKEAMADGELYKDELELDRLILGQDLPTVETKNFLNKIINLGKIERNPYYDDVWVVHDTTSDHAINMLSSEIATSHKLFKLDELDVNALTGKKVFIQLHFEKYNYETLHRLYFKIAAISTGSAISVSYFRGKYFSVSPPYIPEVGSPCHFCEIDRVANLESEIRTRHTWSGALRFCRKNGAAVPSPQLSLLRQCFCIGLLANRINVYTSRNFGRRHQDSAFCLATVNLNTGFISEEKIPHWPLCACLGER